MATLALEPNGVGDETAIPNLVGAATHWQAVLTSDGDTSYVEVPNDDEDWHRDLYTLVNSPALGTIDSVTLRVVGRHGQPLWPFPSGCLKFSLKTYGTVYDVQGQLPSHTYGVEENVWTTNPNTGNPWTWSEINALQAGISLHRSHKFVPGGYFWARCTQVYVVVTYTPAPVVAPTVTTDPATGIEAAAATGNGNITDNGGEDCDKRGFVYNTSPHGDPGDTAPADSEYSNYVEETDSFGTGAFTGSLTSLEPNTTYYVRAYAHNSEGYSYGNEVSFTTLVAAPSVTTNPASALSAIAATPNGTLNQNGGEACECGFEWGLDIGYGVTTPPQSKTIGEAFSQVIGGLFPNTTYHFRAFATNSAGTGYGDDETFTTALVISRAFALAREEL